MNLEQIIYEYVKTLHVPSAREKTTIRNMLLKFYAQQGELNSDTRIILDNLHGFLEKTADGVQSYRRDKNKLNICLRDFIQFFSSYLQVGIDVETFFPPLKFREKSERMIEILKYLHEDPKTREEISQHFGISERALNDDLNELQSGSYSYLGYNMKINLKRGDNTYDSTIHPVFLPLNLSEVFALTLGLKMTGKRTPFEDVYNYIADCIYDQLSPYGQRRISDKAKGEGIYFRDDAHTKAYRYEEDLLNTNLQRERAHLFAYYLKSGAPCEIEYDTFDGIKTVVGRIDFARYRREYVTHRIQINDENDIAIEIDLDKVISIKRVRNRK